MRVILRLRTQDSSLVEPAVTRSYKDAETVANMLGIPDLNALDRPQLDAMIERINRAWAVVDSFSGATLPLGAPNGS